MSTQPHPEAFSGRTNLIVWVLGGLACWVAVLALVAALA